MRSSCCIAQCKKFPLSEPYPLRVVWHLYGERGARDNRLQMFNPQHMKEQDAYDRRCAAQSGQGRRWSGAVLASTGRSATY